MKIFDFLKYKREGRLITMVTSYDASSARILAKSEVDCMLVGDSVSMVVHGFDSTLMASIEMMRTHVEAVRRGAPRLLS